MFCVCCLNSSLEIHTEGQFRSVEVFKYFSKTVVLFILTKIKQSFIERYLRQYMNSMTIDRIERILTNMHEYANI